MVSNQFLIKMLNGRTCFDAAFLTATFLPLMACSCSSIAGMTSSELKTMKAKPLDRPVTGSIFRLTDDTSPNVAKYSRMSSSDASYKFRAV